MDHACRTIISILFISTICISIADGMTCKGDRQWANNFCWLTCLKSDSSSISLEVSCQETSTSWVELFLGIRIPPDMLKGKYVNLELFNCKFPKNFNLHNFLDSLGIADFNEAHLNTVSIVAPWASFKNASVIFLVDSSISRLEIEGSTIKTIPNGLLRTADTWQLRISKNSLSVVKSNDLTALDELLDLDLSDNNIEIIEPGAFDALRHLQAIDLSSNYLSSLPDGSFDKLRKLTKIDLSSNSLNELPAHLFDSLNLVEIFLDNNQLKNLPGKTFGYLQHLRHVELKNNNLTSLPDDLFEAARSLQRLSLDQNHLKDLPESIFKDTSLKRLSLASNELISLSS